MSNATSNGSSTRSPSTQIIEKPKRRRFSIEEKLRILREADACAPGTVGAFLRREGIYSSQLYAWRHERERGDLDGGIVRKRHAARAAQRAEAQRIAELEREIRILKRRNERLELFEEIRKKAAGLLGLDLKSPEIDEND
jgi:transposase